MVRGTQSAFEELVLPFPGRSPRERVPVVERFRSTWLSSSLRSLREHKLFDTYLTHLPQEHHAAILDSVVGVWLPVRVCLAHYAACDALQLPNADIIQIGREAAYHVHGTLLATFVRLAKGAGVTPWTMFERLNDLWGRIWIGGGCSVARLGPKEARLEVAGWPCAQSNYCRTGMRGVIPGMTDLFCQKSYAHEITPLTTKTSLAYLVAWA